jgi:RNA polymerase sigma factor (sigma-70 family)
MSEESVFTSLDEWDRIYATLLDLAPVVLRRLDPSIDKNDIVQDVAVRLLHMRVNGTLPNEFRAGLLATMLKHRAIDVLRSNQRRISTSYLDSIEADSIAIAETSRSSLLLDLEIALQRLPEDDQRLFRDFMNGVKTGILAKKAGTKYSAMAQRLHRIKDKLRDWLQELE